MMDFLLLSDEQTEFVYMNYMKTDFPPSELKPLAFIRKAVDNGIYSCFGFFDDDRIVGYLFLEKLKDSDDYLIDYLAVISENRNNGFGSDMLKTFVQKYPDASSILVEVEDPDFADNNEDAELQTRRYNFYLRNGFCDTGLRAKCYGVPFRVIETGSNRHTKDETERLYRMQYKAIWPKKMYDTKLFTY